MSFPAVRFSIASHAAWSPGIETAEAWLAWAADPFVIEGSAEPGVRAMAPLLRRRAGMVGKMALEVAYQCAGDRADIPSVFCSRHGEVARSLDLLSDLAQGEPLSPAAFGLSVHNAAAGLFSIARADRANNIALAAGAATVEHAVIEACALLADGARAVLLVAYDAPLPPLYRQFQDWREQPYAWAWLMQEAAQDAIGLSWSGCEADTPRDDAGIAQDMPAGLAILRFQLSGDRSLVRENGGRRWHWTRNA